MNGKRLQQRLCSVDQCKNRAEKCSLCGKHYRRLRLYGDVSSWRERFLKANPADVELGKIPLTSGKYAIVDADMYEYLMKWKWHVKNGRYAVRRDQKTRKFVYMHRVIARTPDGLETDHIDGDGLNNRRANLRHCTHQQNGWNQRQKRRKYSRFQGVSWKDKRWIAQITVNGKVITLGTYTAEEDAAEAYNVNATYHFGEFAHLNVVE